MRGHGNSVLYKELTGDQQTLCNTVSNMPNIANYTEGELQFSIKKGFKASSNFQKIKELKNIVLRVFQLSPESLRSSSCTSIDNLPKSGRPEKMTKMVEDFIETQINKQFAPKVIKQRNKKIHYSLMIFFYHCTEATRGNRARIIIRQKSCSLLILQ